MCLGIEDFLCLSLGWQMHVRGSSTVRGAGEPVGVYAHEARCDCAAVDLMEAEGQELEMFELEMGHCLQGGGGCCLWLA